MQYDENPDPLRDSIVYAMKYFRCACGCEIAFRTRETGEVYPIRNGCSCQGRELIVSDGPTCFPTSCPICSGQVFFVRYNNGSVWLDELGPPWPIHGCFAEGTRQIGEPGLFAEWKGHIPGFSMTIVRRVFQERPRKVIQVNRGGENFAGIPGPFEGESIEDIVRGLFAGTYVRAESQEGSDEFGYRKLALALPPEAVLLLGRMGLTGIHEGQVSAHLDYSSERYELFGFGGQERRTMNNPGLADWAVEESACLFVRELQNALLMAILAESKDSPIDVIANNGIGLSSIGIRDALGIGSLLLLNEECDRLFLDGVGLVRFLPAEFCPMCPQVFPKGELEDHKEQAH